MTRRTIGRIVIFAPGLLLMPLATQMLPAGKVPRIGVLGWSFPPYEAGLLPASLRQGLRALGWVEGQNLVIERRYAGWRVEKLPNLVADLIRLKVDVIVALVGSPARAAK
jgi:putative ABC transport system substrate-binding protein